MANRVKTISKYSGSAWGTEVPIGADATNVDMTTAPSDYDSSSSETSKVLIGTNDVKVIASDTDLTAWGKFNRFRRRVSNKFADYFATANVKTSYQTTGANGDVYSTSLLNSYFSNVIGYTGSSAPTAGSVASQLESLNSKVITLDQTVYSYFQDAGWAFNIGHNWLTKRGNIIMGGMHIDRAMGIPGPPYTILRVPEGFRPTIGITIQGSFGTSNGWYTYNLNIDTDGGIQAPTPPSGSTSLRFDGCWWV